MRGRRPPLVLVVEDDDDTLATLCELLEERGYQCWLARDAGEAISRTLRERRTPDLVLIDLRMPGTPVTELIPLVRARARPAAVPVLLMTAVSPSEVPPGLDVDAVLLKPFDQDALFGTISRALSSVGGEATRTVPPSWTD